MSHDLSYLKDLRKWCHDQGRLMWYPLQEEDRGPREDQICWVLYAQKVKETMYCTPKEYQDFLRKHGFIAKTIGWHFV